MDFLIGNDLVRAIERRDRLIGQNEDVELAQTEIVTVNRRKATQFLQQLVLKSYEAIKILENSSSEL